MNEDYRLNSERVEEVFRNCLFLDDEDKTNFVPAYGITSNVGFHPGRLEGHKEEIINMLHQLPDNFQAKLGGGWSFLNACQDKHGNQWTDFHQRMEQLFQLGIAIDKVKCQFPREMWKALPGGVPYYIVEE